MKFVNRASQRRGIFISRTSSLAKTRKVSLEQAHENFVNNFLLTAPERWTMNTWLVFVHVVKGAILQRYRGNFVEIAVDEFRRSIGRAGHDAWNSMIYPVKQGHTTFNNKGGRVVKGHNSRYDYQGHLHTIMAHYQHRDRSEYEQLMERATAAAEQVTSSFKKPVTWFVKQLRLRFSHVKAIPAPTYTEASLIRRSEGGLFLSDEPAQEKTEKFFSRRSEWLRACRTRSSPRCRPTEQVTLSSVCFTSG